MRTQRYKQGTNLLQFILQGDGLTESTMETHNEKQG